MRMTRWAARMASVLMITAGMAPAGDAGNIWVGSGKPARLFLFAGQSNMNGSWSDIRTVPKAMRAKRDRVWELNLGNDDHLLGLRPFDPERTLDKSFKGGSFNEQQTNWFGAEVSFAANVAAKSSDPLIIAKFAASATGLANSWDPASKDGLYSRMIAATRTIPEKAAKEKLRAVPAAFFWYQGESDAMCPPFADAYEKNLRAFIARLRADLGTPTLPVVIVRIHKDSFTKTSGGPFPGLKTVRAAQAEVARDPGVSLVDIDDLDNSRDGLHLSSQALVTLGERLAKLVLKSKPGAADEPKDGRNQ